MAFTDLQKIKIRYYLGYPNIYLQCNPLLESAVSIVGNNADMKSEAENILAKLSDIDDRLTSIALDVAGIQTAGTGDPGFFEGSVQSELRSAGRMWVGRLSILVGVAIPNDVYSNKGYASGWDWGSAANQYSIPNGL